MSGRLDIVQIFVYGRGSERDRGFLQGEFRTLGRLATPLTGKQDKDTSRYDLTLAQSLDDIRAKTQWLEVRTHVLSRNITLTLWHCSARQRIWRGGWSSGRGPRRVAHDHVTWNSG